jgi:hypothetical protein
MIPKRPRIVRALDNVAYWLGGQVVGRGVAQSGRVLGWGPSGRRFESCLPDHLLPLCRLETQLIRGDDVFQFGIQASANFFRSARRCVQSVVVITIVENDIVGQIDADGL